MLTASFTAHLKTFNDKCTAHATVKVHTVYQTM